jgi:hypothetical protein
MTTLALRALLIGAVVLVALNGRLGCLARPGRASKRIAGIRGMALLAEITDTKDAS